MLRAYWGKKVDSVGSIVSEQLKTSARVQFCTLSNQNSTTEKQEMTTSKYFGVSEVASSSRAGTEAM